MPVPVCHFKINFDIDFNTTIVVRTARATPGLPRATNPERNERECETEFGAMPATLSMRECAGGSERGMQTRARFVEAAKQLFEREGALEELSTWRSPRAAPNCRVGGSSNVPSTIGSTPETSSQDQDSVSSLAFSIMILR
jgi:hypothetical protein